MMGGEKTCCGLKLPFPAWIWLASGNVRSLWALVPPILAPRKSKTAIFLRQTGLRRAEVGYPEMGDDLQYRVTDDRHFSTLLEGHNVRRKRIQRPADFHYINGRTLSPKAPVLKTYSLVLKSQASPT